MLAFADCHGCRLDKRSGVPGVPHHPPPLRRSVLPIKVAVVALLVPPGPGVEHCAIVPGHLVIVLVPRRKVGVQMRTETVACNKWIRCSKRVD